MFVSFKKWLETCSVGNAMGTTGSIAVTAGALDAQRIPVLQGVRNPKQDQLPPSKKKPRLVNNQVPF